GGGAVSGDEQKGRAGGTDVPKRRSLGEDARVRPERFFDRVAADVRDARLERQVVDAAECDDAGQRGRSDAMPAEIRGLERDQRGEMPAGRVSRPTDP